MASSSLRGMHLLRQCARASLRRTYATEAAMPLTFASPAKCYYNSKGVKQIDVPTFSGSVGILPNHVPVLAALKPGVVTVYEDSGTQAKFFVSSGMLTVNGDGSVQVIAEEACMVDELDVAAARAELETVKNLASRPGEEGIEAQIKTEVLEAIAHAAESK